MLTEKECPGEVTNKEGVQSKNEFKPLTSGSKMRAYSDLNLDEVLETNSFYVQKCCYCCLLTQIPSNPL